MKRMEIGREEVIVSLFVEDMIVYISKPKDSTSEPLELTNSFRKVASYRINSQRSTTGTSVYTRLREKSGKQHPSQ